MHDPLDQVRVALSDERVVTLDRWMAAIQRRCWALAPGNALDLQLRSRCDALLCALSDALAGASELRFDTSEFREPIKILSFTAGWMVAAGLPIGAGIALCHGLCDVLGPLPDVPCEAFVVAVAEAYAAAQRDHALARHQQIMRKSQVVLMLSDRLGALLLVGDPDHEALADAVGRLMMLAVMRRPANLVVDVAHAVDGERLARESLLLIATHAEALQGSRLILAGLARQRSRQATAELELTVTCYEDLEQVCALCRSLPPA